MIKTSKLEFSNEAKYFKELLGEFRDATKEYQQGSKKKSKDKLIALTLALSQYYYEHNEMDKSKHHLKEILILDEKVENVHLYLGLIALYENDNDLGSKEIAKEVKLFPKNSFAKELQEKIQVSITFPYISLFLIFFLLGITAFFGGTLTLTSLFSYGLNSTMITFASSVSSIFIHTSWTHVISNILILILFGHILEKYIGSLKYTIIFLISAIVGNLAQAIFYPTVSGFVVGASAGMFGILGALLIRYPLLETRVFGFLKVPLIYILGLLFSISILLPISLFNTAEIAHIIGLFTGIFLAGLMYQENISVFYNWIFVAFGLLIWTLGIQNIFISSEIFIIVISVFISCIGLGLAIFGYTLLERSSLKKGGNLHE